MDTVNNTEILNELGRRFCEKYPFSKPNERIMKITLECIEIFEKNNLTIAEIETVDKYANFILSQMTCSIKPSLLSIIRK